MTIAVAEALLDSRAEEEDETIRCRVVERMQHWGRRYPNQLTVETDRDPLTGKRNRYYKTVKCGKRQADAELRKMIAEIEGGGITQPSAMKLSDWMDTWLNTYLPNIEQSTPLFYVLKYLDVNTLHFQCENNPSVLL